MDSSLIVQEIRGTDPLLSIQQQRIANLLSRSTLERTQEAIKEFKHGLNMVKSPTVSGELAGEVLENHFDALSGVEMEVLVFYILAEVIEDIDKTVIEFIKAIQILELIRQKYKELIILNGELYYKVDYGVIGDQIMTVASLKALQSDLKGKLDEMNEMSEIISLRLQMTMDRRSKFISTLSQLMKKIATTQDLLIQNIK